MTTQKMESKTRQHVHDLEIAASPEAVWKAITDADQLVQWFPLQAAVQPGKGGSITYGWGDLSGACKIVEWQPPSHLRTSWLAHNVPEGEPGEPLVVDWFLEGDKGSTRLRLVHSGFGAGPSWDDEYEGTRRGWDFELLSLKHYLEHHRGKGREAFWLRRPIEDARQAWGRLVSPTGLVRVADVGTLKRGDRVRFELSSGDSIEGVVYQNETPTEFGFSVKNLNNGLMRVGCEVCGGQLEAHLWVSLWALPSERLRDLKRRLERAFDEAVG